MLVDNCMLRRILKFKRYEMMGSWGMLHKEELHYSLSSPDTVNPLMFRSFVLVQLLYSISNLYSVFMIHNLLICCFDRGILGHL